MNLGLTLLLMCLTKFHSRYKHLYSERFIKETTSYKHSHLSIVHIFKERFYLNHQPQSAIKRGALYRTYNSGQVLNKHFYLFIRLTNPVFFGEGRILQNNKKGSIRDDPFLQKNYN